MSTLLLIFVKNSIPARDFKMDTNQQVNITVDNTAITIFNLYCPVDKELFLQLLDTPAANVMAVATAIQPARVMKRPTEDERRWRIGRLTVN